MKWLILTILFITSIYAQTFQGGDGTQSDPYQIAYAIELDSIRLYYNNHFILLNDIDLNDLPMTAKGNWTPIPQAPGNAWYDLDGAGYTIRNMRQINLPDGDFTGDKKYGFFQAYALGSYAGNGQPYLENLRFANAQLSDTTGSTKAKYMGVVAGNVISPVVLSNYRIYNIIMDSCTVEFYDAASITAATMRIACGVGEVANTAIGRMAITNSYLKINLIKFLSPTMYSGILFGKNDLVPWDISTDRVGVDQCFVYNSHATVVESDPTSVGGVRVGAFMGTDQGAVGYARDCYISKSSLIITNYSRNPWVYAMHSGGTSGAGNCSDTTKTVIKNFYSSTTLSNTELDNDGFVYHYNYRKLNGSVFFNSDSTNRGYSYLYRTDPLVCVAGDTALGVTTATLQDPNTFIDAGWDMDSVWAIDATVNEGMPYLRWLPFITNSIEFTEPSDFTDHYYGDTVNFKWAAVGDTNFVLTLPDTTVTVIGDTTYDYLAPNLNVSQYVRVELQSDSLIYDELYLNFFGEKELKIDTIYNVEDDQYGRAQVDVVTRSLNINVGQYYVNDGGTWYSIGKDTLNNTGTVGLDTVRLVPGISPYQTFRVVEVADTLSEDTFYDIELETEDETSLLDNTQTCTQWKLLGINKARYINDITCGWSFGRVKVRKVETIVSTIGDPSEKLSFSRNISAFSDYYDFETPCKTGGGYNLLWDVWLCNIGTQNAVGLDTIKVGDIRYRPSGKYIYAEWQKSVDTLLTTAVWTSPYIGSYGNNIGIGLAGSNRFYALENNDVAKRIYLVKYPNLVVDILHDDYTMPSETIITRNYFRGIHPKIWKWGQPDGIRRD